MNLKDRLKIARQKASFTQKELADSSGVKQQTISAIETGKAFDSPGLIKLAMACGVRPEWLLTGDGDMLPHKTTATWLATTEDATGQFVGRVTPPPGLSEIADSLAQTHYTLTPDDIASITGYIQIQASQKKRRNPWILTNWKRSNTPPSA